MRLKMSDKAIRKEISEVLAGLELKRLKQGRIRQDYEELMPHVMGKG